MWDGPSIEADRPAVQMGPNDTECMNLGYDIPGSGPFGAGWVTARLATLARLAAICCWLARVMEGWVLVGFRGFLETVGPLSIEWRVNHSAACEAAGMTLRSHGAATFSYEFGATSRNYRESRVDNHRHENVDIVIRKCRVGGAQRLCSVRRWLQADYPLVLTFHVRGRATVGINI